MTRGRFRNGYFHGALGDVLGPGMLHFMVGSGTWGPRIRRESGGIVVGSGTWEMTRVQPPDPTLPPCYAAGSGQIPSPIYNISKGGMPFCEIFHFFLEF